MSLKSLVAPIWMDAVLSEIDTIRCESDRTRRGNPLCVLVLGMRAHDMSLVILAALDNSIQPYHLRPSWFGMHLFRCNYCIRLPSPPPPKNIIDSHVLYAVVVSGCISRVSDLARSVDGHAFRCQACPFYSTR